MLAFYLRDDKYVSSNKLHTIQFPAVFPKPSKEILHWKVTSAEFLAEGGKKGEVETRNTIIKECVD